MMDWNALVKDAVLALGADKVLVPGAKVREHVSVIARQKGASLEDQLKSTGMKFGQLVDEVPGVVTHRRVGTDMLVGLEGAEWPEEKKLPPRQWEPGRFRTDVYGAFTRIVEEPYFYDPEQDLFTQTPENSDQCAPVPRVTLEDLLAERRTFAESQTVDTTRSTLLGAVDHSPGPLGDFQRAVVNLRLGGAWHLFKITGLKKRLQTWADANGVPVRPSWFDDTPRAAGAVTPQELLSRTARYMTDEDVRELRLPFRVLEEMYRDLARRRGP